MADFRQEWQAWTDRSTVLGTELNSLASGSRTNAGTEFDNETELDVWGRVRLSVTFGTNPSAGGYVAVYAVHCEPGGSTYADGSSSVDPGAHTLICTIPVRATTNAQVLDSKPFRMLPLKTKFILANQSGQAFPASGSTLELFTGSRKSEEIV